MSGPITAEFRERQVRDLFASFGQGREAGCAEVRKIFAADARWETPVTDASVGPEEAVSMIERFESAAGVHRTEMEIVSLAVDGDTVLVEHVDRAYREDGSVIMEVPEVAVIRFEGDRLLFWREYFDPAAMSTDGS